MKSVWRSNEDLAFGMPRLMPCIKWLLILNFSIFLLQLVFLLMHRDLLEKTFALWIPLTGNWHPWQFLTYLFLHVGALHLICNLLMLFFFGNEVEAELGSKRFLQFYFMGGMMGGLLWFAVNFSRGGVMVGASGAIYAVTIAFATLFPNRPITLLLFFILPVTLLARYWALIAVGLSVIFALSDTGDIGHLAHLGGMAVGYLYVKALESHWNWRSLEAFFGRAPVRTVSRRPIEVIPTPFAGKNYMSQKIDPILDKIAEHGIQSLTPEERRLLEETKDRIP